MFAFQMFGGSAKQSRVGDGRRDADSKGKVQHDADGLTVETLRSLAAFSTAHVLEQRCLFAVASRTDPADLMQFRLMFNGMDTDRDGRVDRMELIRALERARRWSSVPLNVDTLFRAIDQDRNGVVSFMEFVAGCLYARLAPLDEWLADETFESLDIDQDGLLSVRDVLTVFQDVPPGLPALQRFGKDEWRRSLLAEFAARNHVNDASSAETRPLSLLTQVMFGTCSVKDDSVAADFLVVPRGNKNRRASWGGSDGGGWDGRHAGSRIGGGGSGQEHRVRPRDDHRQAAALSGPYGLGLSSPTYVPISVR